jgi:transcriptional accessory protein Tex/SPT6
MDKINQRIATELGVAPGQVAAAVELLGEGSTVPFIARYLVATITIVSLGAGCPACS